MLRRPSLNSPPFPKRPRNRRGNYSLTLHCHSVRLGPLPPAYGKMLTSEQMLFTMALFGHVLVAGLTLLIAVTLDDPV
jgi:hypothetical protein